MTVRRTDYGGKLLIRFLCAVGFLNSRVFPEGLQGQAGWQRLINRLLT
jgi:hypothetical protein